MNRLSLLLSTCMAASAALLSVPALAATPPHFAIQGDQFLLDGKPYIIRSGEMHYPRIPHAEWRDRLRKARAMGLNTITTYAFWNASEPEPGKFDFSGDNDIAAFVRTAQEEGLNVIVRPGPFVCAEWEFGGFPAWLLRTPGLRVRSYDPRFLAASAAWFKRLGQELAPLQSTRGGPILMMQVENEYGYGGNDRDYMEAIRKQMIDAGFDVPLFMSNGPGPTWMSRGTLPGLVSVINFTGDAKKTERAFQRSAPMMHDMPKMAGEYWSGWYDRWSEPHKTRGIDEVTGAVGWMLDHGISFNLYMIDGGTNFGFCNGANHRAQNDVWPVITSYDYGAPIGEPGNRTPLYDSLRAVYARYTGAKLPEVPAPMRSMRIDSIRLEPVRSGIFLGPDRTDIPTMEAAQRPYGYMMYWSDFEKGASGTLSLDGVRDYATVSVNDSIVATVDHNMPASKVKRKIKINVPAGGRVKIIVENMGRINFGSKLWDDHKGLTKAPEWNGKRMDKWSSHQIMDYVAPLDFQGSSPAVPFKQNARTCYRGTFSLNDTADTWLDMHGFGKGVVVVNGHNLGRYWEIGPQYSLYVPGVWLHKGENHISILDMLGRKQQYYITATDHPVNR